MKTDEFTKLLVEKLGQIFLPNQIIPEWPAHKESEDDFNNTEYYSPRVDIAVGPFNQNGELDVNNARFNELITENSEWLRKLYDISHLAGDSQYTSFEEFLSFLNPNPRCFIAIEIENTKDAKRSLGDIVNASVMGKVGIAIPIGTDKYNMFVKIKNYFHYLKQVRKLESEFKNILIIEGGKLIKNL